MCFIGVFVFVDVAEAAAVAAFADTSVPLETSEDTTAIDMSKVTSLFIKEIKEWYIFYFDVIVHIDPIDLYSLYDS